jgi:UDP-N-acetylmuramoyl-L-alanyl-D-glutamate--2,6-diaminopimelate ligase
MIGVTGTNGKTSITQFVATILTKLGIACGVIGTIGVGFPGKLTRVINTTLDPVTLQRWLFKLSSSGAKAVAMEVSSQGLMMGRVNGIDFTIAVFTNLTREHLDYHGTMAQYGEAKKSLFLKHNVKQAVINADDEFGRSLIQELKTSLDVYAYTVSDNISDKVPIVRAKDIQLTLAGIMAAVTTPWGKGQLNSQLLGKFNLSNLLAVLTVLGIMKIGIKEALAGIASLSSVNGRMQIFGGAHNKPLVVVDYAHTPDAMEKVLLTLREYCRGALWCVFGCGGDRDRGKRPVMGQVAERSSDHVVITNDNPRTEDPKQIVDDILQGLLCPWAVEVEYDRMAAINYAIHCAKENDVILIAGKGHEDYQIVGKESLPFSDQEVVIKALGMK